MGAIAILLVAINSALSQGSYPARPVTLVVSAGAGGPNDLEARQYATKMTQSMGQPFVLDFKPGAGTTIGTAYVAKAAPDGHTLLVVTVNFTVVKHFYKEAPFDTLKDFAPITQMSERTTIFLAAPSFPAKSLKEYVAYAKANPGKINFATSGAGGISHLGGAWLHGATDSKVTFVHYKGAGAVLIDMMSGRVDVGPATYIAAMPLIKSGKLRPLAIMQNKRTSLLPDVQTVAEQGVANYNYPSWLGFVAPVATPHVLILRLRDEFAQIAKAPDLVANLAADGGVMVVSTPEEFRKRIVSETALFKKLIEENGITLAD